MVIRPSKLAATKIHGHYSLLGEPAILMVCNARGKKTAEARCQHARTAMAASELRVSRYFTALRWRHPVDICRSCGICYPASSITWLPFSTGWQTLCRINLHKTKELGNAYSLFQHNRSDLVLSVRCESANNLLEALKIQI